MMSAPAPTLIRVQARVGRKAGRPAWRCQRHPGLPTQGGLCRWLVLWTLLAVAVGDARASPRKSAPNKAAHDDGQAVDQALRGARQALATGDLASAERLATSSFRRDPSPDALYLLGRVALAQNRPLAAHDLMRRYLADPTLDASADSAEQRDAADILQKPIPESAQLNILGDREALVFIDGQLVGRLPLSRPLLISPSPHKVELVRGDRRIEDSVRVPLGRLAELRCDLSSRTSLLSILPSIVVLPQTVDDGGGQAALLRVLQDAMAKERVAPLAADLAFALFGEPRPGPCDNQRRCTIALAQASEADYLLYPAFRKTGNAQTVVMQLVDGQLGEPAASGERTCRGCTAEATAAQVVELFSTLYDQARKRPRSRLELQTEPSGAQLVLDDEPLGTTPFEGGLFAGTRHLRIKQPGYLEDHRQVTLIDGQTSRLTIALQPEPEPAPAALQRVAEPTGPPPGKRSTLRLVFGAASLAGGALLSGYGISGLALNGRCEDLSIVDTTQCPQIYKTGTAGGVLLGLGIALTGTGVLLLALPPAKPKSASRAAGDAASAPSEASKR